MSLTIDITDVTEVPMPQAGGFPARAEAAGFDGVGVRDNQATGRDSYLRLAMAALQTSRVNLFPAVGNPITRHPAPSTRHPGTPVPWHPGIRNRATKMGEAAFMILSDSARTP